MSRLAELFFGLSMSNVILKPSFLVAVDIYIPCMSLDVLVRYLALSPSVKVGCSAMSSLSHIVSI